MNTNNKFYKKRQETAKLLAELVDQWDSTGEGQEEESKSPHDKFKLSLSVKAQEIINNTITDLYRTAVEVVNWDYQGFLNSSAEDRINIMDRRVIVASVYEFYVIKNEILPLMSKDISAEFECYGEAIDWANGLSENSTEYKIN